MQETAVGIPSRSLTVICPAKVNLYLNTLGKRSDGFHEIESIFHAVTLCDKLLISPQTNFKWSLAPDSSIRFSDQDREKFINNNILVKIYDYFRKQYRIPGVKVELSKHIPVGAGLGGGSSDAAGFISGLNRLFRLKLSRRELMEIGAGFGSDIPFFFLGGMAWVSGRGEVIEKSPLAIDHPILLTYPGRFIETARSYRELNTLHPRKSMIGIKEEVKRIISDRSLIEERKKVKKDRILKVIEKNLFNGFQRKTLKTYPDLLKTYQILKKKSDFCLMSGSGSSFFAIFHDRINAKNVYSQLRKFHPSTFWIRLTASGLRIIES